MTDDDKSRNKILDKALYYYQELGLSIIPVGKNKVALVDWKKYQTEKPTLEEINKWFSKPSVNIAVVCGSISSIACVDIDIIDDNESFSHAAINLMEQLPATWHTNTPSGGHHYIYKLSKQLKSYKNDGVGIEIKAEGTYIVLPPSVSESGIEYTFQVAPWYEPEGITEFPYELLSETFDLNTNGKEDSLEMLEGFPIIYIGQRNNKLTSIAGELLSVLPDKPELCRLSLHGINKTVCEEPLPDKEVDTILESVKSYHTPTEEQQEKAAKLLSFKPVKVAELLQKKFLELPWIVEKLIPEKGITIISGNPSSYKTWIALEIAKSVASGNMLFDQFKTSQCGVLFIDEENGDQTLHQRLKLLSVDGKLPIHFLPKSGFNLNSESIRGIVDFAKSNNVKLVFFDSLIRIHDAEENNAKEMAQVFRLLKELTINGLTVICIHHNRKEGFQSNNPRQSLRGSSDILASADCHLAIERKEETVTVRQSKLRQGKEMSGFKLNLIADDNGVAFEYTGEVDEAQTKVEDAKEVIKNQLEGITEKPNKSHIHRLLKDKGFNFGDSTIKGAINEMLKEKELYSKKGKGNSTFLSLTPFEDDSEQSS